MRLIRQTEMEDESYTLDVRIRSIPSLEDAENLLEQITLLATEIGAQPLGGFYETPEDEAEVNHSTEFEAPRRNRRRMKTEQTGKR
jgi:hypothetical protein